MLIQITSNFLTSKPINGNPKMSGDIRSIVKRGKLNKFVRNNMTPRTIFEVYNFLAS